MSGRYLPIEIDSKSFPVIGLSSADEGKAKIERERTVAATDLTNTRVDVLADYEDPFPWGDSHPEKMIEPEKIRIRRDGERLVLEAVGHVQQQDPEEKSRYHITGEERVLARATLPVGSFLRIARSYMEHQGASQQQIKDFESVGDLTAVEEVEAQRTLLHTDLGRMMEKRLAGQPIKFGNPDILENVKPYRYLTTALIMHLLPASAFENEGFMHERVRPKGSRRPKRPAPAF